MTTWTIVDTERPRSLNAERRMHWREHRRLTALDLERWGWLIKKARIPPMTACFVEALPSYDHHPQDAGNCYPSVKAAIDALVAQGVVPDDDPAHVRGITMHAPDPTNSNNGLTLLVRSAAPPRLDLARVATALRPLAEVPLPVTGAGITSTFDHDTIHRARTALASLEFTLCSMTT